MELMQIEGSPKTPTVDFNPSTGVFLLQGRSIPENSFDFYKPIYDWIEDYGQHAAAKSEIHMKLEYFNTSSSKCILEVFKRFAAIKKTGKEVSVLWHYEEDDEDMLEAGEDYDAIIDLDFEMVKVASF